MIGAFLQAELDSSRFRAGSQKALQMLNLPTSLITNPDYSKPDQNQERSQVLGLTRGWPNQWLFTNFPTDVEWFLVNLSQFELTQAYRLKGRPNFNKSDRKLSAIVAKIRSHTFVDNVDPNLIQQISTRITTGPPLTPIIILSTSLKDDKVLLEGHSRSLAYCLQTGLQNGIDVILGISSQMRDWEYY